MLIIRLAPNLLKRGLPSKRVLAEIPNYSYNQKVNGQLLISVFLVTVLCISQTAANLHVTSHLQPTQHQHADQVISDHHDSHHSLSEHTETDDSDSDCAIYHAFAGLNGLLPVDTETSVLRVQCIPTRTAYDALDITRISFDKNIRGPPPIS